MLFLSDVKQFEINKRRSLLKSSKQILTGNRYQLNNKYNHLFVERMNIKYN